METAPHKRWIVRNPDGDQVAALQRCGFSSVIAWLLVSRGVVDQRAAERFLRGGLSDLPDPFLLRGIHEAATRLVTAVEQGESICVYGDYDVDGVTATALLVRFFGAIAATCTYHVPHRIEEGYGLSRSGLAKIAAAGARVVISVDCGITAVAEAVYCRETGLDLIITDHHLPGDTLPDALAVINPQQPGCHFPGKGLAGVGLAFYLAIAVRARLREAGYFKSSSEPDLRAYLDLVALGTIADMVPINDENRLLVRYGLTELSRTKRAGIVALKQVAGITNDVNCGMVGFRLGPRLNAAGRLENAASGVALLLTEDPVQARQLANELDAANRARQELEQEILAEAVRQVERLPRDAGRRSIVLASADWHPGVVGIVASRLVERYHRPTILIAMQNGQGKGSGRSIPALHLKDALDACAEHLLHFGGHRQAAGLSVAGSGVGGFVARFEEVAAGLLAEDDLVPQLWIDAELSGAMVTLHHVEELQQLAPFGIGNPEPLFLVRNALVASVRQLTGGHLRLLLSWQGESLPALYFSPGEQQIQPGERIDLAVALQTNFWQGTTRVQLRVKDVRPAGREVADAA